MLVDEAIEFLKVIFFELCICPNEFDPLMNFQKTLKKIICILEKEKIIDLETTQISFIYANNMQTT